LKNLEGDLDAMGINGPMVRTWVTVYAPGQFSYQIGLINIIYRSLIKH